MNRLFKTLIYSIIVGIPLYYIDLDHVFICIIEALPLEMEPNHWLTRKPLTDIEYFFGSPNVLLFVAIMTTIVGHIYCKENNDDE